MVKKKQVQIITSAIIAIIIIISIIISFIISCNNRKIKNQKLKVVIYQYHTVGDDKMKAPSIIYSKEFTSELEEEMTIYALDGEQSKDFNHISIKNGIIEVTDADCYEHVCMHSKIDLNNKSLSLLRPNLTTIECKPHGLKITLEEIK